MSSRELFEQIVADGWAGLAQMVLDHRQESLHLEFKEKDPKTTTLDEVVKGRVAKAMSGFANVEGGVLLIGIRGKPPSAKEPDCADEVVPIQDVSRFHDELGRHLIEFTSPTIGGVTTVVIADPANPGTGVVAMYVPDSLGKPHRATGGPATVRDRYYMRTDANTAIMPHSLLAALFAQTTPPRLRMVAKFQRGGEGDFVRYWVVNTGRGSARSIAVRCDLEQGTGWSGVTHPSPWQARRQNHPDGRSSLLLSPREDIVLYPGDNIELPSYKIMAGIERQKGGNGCVVRLKGAIYALDAQTVLFDRQVVVIDAEPPVTFPTLDGDDQ